MQSPHDLASTIRSMLPLKFRAMAILLQLAAIASPRLLLVTRHARSQGDIYPRWRGESEALCYFHEIELVDVEDAAEAVRGVGLEIGAVAVFGGLGNMLVLSGGGQMGWGHTLLR